MSQRSALLAIYGSLGDSGKNDRRRGPLFDELIGASYDLKSQDESGSQDGSARRDSLPPAARSAGDTLSTSAEDVVLDAEVLEAIVALSIDHTFDTQEAFVSDVTLLQMASRLVVDPVAAEDVLRVVFEIREDEQLTAARPKLLRGPTGVSGPQHLAPDPHIIDLLDAPPTALDVARTSLIAAGVELVPALVAQPGARCQARLVPLSLGGEGEYGISFRTDVCFEMPPDLRVADFVADLFEPSTWPQRHSFWISMDEVAPADQTTGAAALISRMAQAQGVGEAAGADFGQRRVFDEAVGNRGNPGGTWPGTLLVFTDSHVVGTDGEPNRHYLEYRLVPGISRYLQLDDGTIQVVEDGTNVCCTVTKMLFFSETRYSTQAEVMAEYACLSGWADQTRIFLMNWIDHTRSNNTGSGSTVPNVAQPDSNQPESSLGGTS